MGAEEVITYVRTHVHTCDFHLKMRLHGERIWERELAVVFLVPHTAMKRLAGSARSAKAGQQ
ncbi:hypothetical protein XACG102_11230002 [Xanthomonas citri pv. citri]|nr:hypothetical protein XACG102_11230002 [Xanthomonas citri pv. citri]